MALTHYYAIYAEGNGAAATDADVKAGTGAVTYGSSSGHASAEAVAFEASGLTASTLYDLEYVVSDGASDARATTVTFRTMAATGSIVINTPPPIVRV